MIRVRRLVKSFGDRVVLRGIDLDVAQGECLALVGPNGAGKTTLLRTLATLSRPNEGQIEIAGMSLPEQAEEIRRQIGFLSHQTLLYNDLTAGENLAFYGQMYGVQNARERIAAMLHQVDLAPNRHDLVRTFSRGMRQRLAIARALLHDPPVLLMDEPYTGLDQRAASALDRVLGSEGAGRTVLLTTHDLAHGWRISDRVAMLVKGRIAYQAETSPGGPDSESGLDQFRREYERRTA
jgi:heme exporter protein A